MYNGETFTHFTEKEGLSKNSVQGMLEDRHGNLWFGTMGGGVSMFNGETFKHFTQKEGLSHNTVNSILEDSQFHAGQAAYIRGLIEGFGWQKY